MITIKKNSIYLVLLIAVICYANFFTNSFTLEPYYALYPDSTHLYFLQQLHDSTIFSNDLSAVGIINGFKFLNMRPFIMPVYSIVLNFFSLPEAIKIISIILCIGSTILIFRIGINLYDRDFALILSSLFLVYFLSMDTFYAGQSRCFGAAIFCIFLYLFVVEKFIFMPLFVFLGASFYPTYFVSLAIASCGTAFFLKDRLKQLKIYRVYILLLALSIIFSIMGILGSRSYKLLLNNLEIFQDYKYTNGVNVPINIYNPIHVLLNFIFNLNEHSRLYVYYTYFILAVSAIFILARKARAFSLPKEILIIFLSCFIGFAMAYIFHPISASRQFVFCMPLFLVFFLSINIYKAMSRFQIKPIIIALLAVFSFLVLHPRFNDVFDYSKNKFVYEYIKRLPSNILIAGYPKSEIVETIPFFAKRSIFQNDSLRDTALFVYEKNALSERRQDLIKGLYAQNIRELKNFIEKYNIDYFVIEARAYEKEYIDLLCFWRSPLNGALHSNMAEEEQKPGNLLLNLAKNNYDFKVKIKDDDVFIISKEKILNYQVP